MREFELRGMPAVNQVRVPIEYKGVTIDQQLRLDAIIDGCLIVEIKMGPSRALRASVQNSSSA